MNHETLPAQGPGDVNVRELGYSYDLLYDIKTTEQLQNEVEYLAHRLSGLARLCREDGHPIDGYVMTVLEFPNELGKGLDDGGTPADSPA